MSFMRNRYLTLLLLFVAAVISYLVGFTIGLWLLIGMGVIFELAFWFELFFKKPGDRSSERSPHDPIRP